MGAGGGEADVTADALLRAHPIFHTASDATRSALQSASELRVYESGQIVVREGGDQTHILILGSGQLELYRRNREAKTQMLVGLLEPPAVFGDAELYSGSRKWSVSARAAGTLTFLRVPNDAFDAAVEADARVAKALYRDACARHMLVINIMQIFALQKTAHKILRLLWSASKPEPGGMRRAPLSPTRMAHALGMDRKTVSRNLDALTQAGYLVRDGSEVRIQVSEDIAFLARLGKHGLGASWRLADGAEEGEPVDADDADTESASKPLKKPAPSAGPRRKSNG